PGRSPSTPCPPHLSAATTSLICSRLPWTTVSMLSRKRSATSVASYSSSAATHVLPRVEDAPQPTCRLLRRPAGGLVRSATWSRRGRDQVAAFGSVRDEAPVALD